MAVAHHHEITVTLDLAAGIEMLQHLSLHRLKLKLGRGKLALAGRECGLSALKLMAHGIEVVAGALGDRSGALLRELESRLEIALGSEIVHQVAKDLDLDRLLLARRDALGTGAAGILAVLEEHTIHDIEAQGLDGMDLSLCAGGEAPDGNLEDIAADNEEMH